jgi:hypothetical protein
MITSSTILLFDFLNSTKVYLFFPKGTNWIWGPLNFLFAEYRGFSFLGVRGPRRDADHSPACTVDVQN